MISKETFNDLVTQWMDHCRSMIFSSNMEDYLNHPVYRKLVGHGWSIVPWIMEQYRQDSTLPWGFVLQEITGVNIIKDRNQFSPPKVKQQWLEWWEKQQKDTPKAIPTGVALPSTKSVT
jgi:hypothetical protein